MASIARRSDGRWRARYRDASGREHARHFRRKVDAQRWLDSISAAMHEGSYADPHAGRITVAEYAQIRLARQVHLKPSTRSRSTAIVGHHVIPAFGGRPLGTIDRTDVSAWIVDLVHAGLAGPTVRHVHRVPAHDPHSRGR